MKYRFNRRDFLAATAAAGVGALAAGRVQAEGFKTTLKKALIDKPTEETLKSWKAAGFEGMESDVWQIAPKAASAARKVAEKLGMQIHSVLYGWANFNREDAVAKDIADVEVALRACRGYGADALLLVPCRIGPTKDSPLPMPQPWEFEIEFDRKTGHVQRVAAGDNSAYKAYIEAHNQAVDASRKAVEKLIPVAEKTKVIIALENVWNSLWVKPAIFQSFIASFGSPWVQCYFDIGNHVRYAPPEEWIRTLGKLIVKCHVKDFRLNPDGHGGRFVDPRDGSVDWPVVRKELDKLGYNGWMTIEGSGNLSLAERNKRLDLIIAGK
jgi:hexulose-6-phosphate isomerase